jgi:hypothetical protein
MADLTPEELDSLKRDALAGQVAPWLAKAGIKPRALVPLLKLAANARAKWEGGRVIALDKNGGRLYGLHGQSEGPERLAADLVTEYPELFFENERKQGRPRRAR